MKKTQRKPPLVWQKQEIPFDHPDSRFFFRLLSGKSVVATSNAIAEFSQIEIVNLLLLLEKEAKKHDGLDYLQTFKSKDGRKLWIIEDGLVITALLPEEY